MKTRTDFVSNSSSASFVVITDSGKQQNPRFEGECTLPDGEAGEAEFGWQTEKYSDFWSKLNWCAIVARTKYNQEKYDSPDEALKEQVKTPWFRYENMIRLLEKTCAGLGFGKITLNLAEDGYADERHGGYIDHQSNIGEEPANGRMFRSEKTLRDFLLNEGSYIDCSNDNGGRDDDEYDWEKCRYSSQPPDYYKA